MADTTETTDDLEAVDIGKLFTEFSDHTVAEMMLTIKELRDALEKEKTAHSYDERLLRKAEEELNTLRGRINASTAILNGDADICIDCEAVKEHTEKDE